MMSASGLVGLRWSPQSRSARGPVAAAGLALFLVAASSAAPAVAQPHEVWLVDQSDSAAGFGGRILIYDGDDLSGDAVESATPAAVVDLAAATAALCLSDTGATPVRPHMLFFNSTHSHAILSFVASGHVVIFDAAAREPVACLRMSVGASGARQAHAAFPAADDSFVLVANQNGKLLERIRTDYAAGVYTHEPAATLDLGAACTTPGGEPCEAPGVRPDNAPICPILDSAGRLAFVTLRGGGLFVVDPRSTPMRILADYDLAAVHPNGCGGVENGGSMYLTSGGGTATNLAEFDLYRFPLFGYQPGPGLPPPAPELLFSDDTDERDAHGMLATRLGRYLWVGDRDANVIEIFAAAGGTRVHTLQLGGGAIADPAPDLMDISPSGHRVYVATRGPNPLSGDPHSSTGSDPGMLVLQVRNAGRGGAVVGLVPITNLDAGGVERADAHGLRVRLR
jgi:hypothetical protein